MKKHILLIASFLLLAVFNLFSEEDKSFLYGISGKYNNYKYNNTIHLDANNQIISPTFDNLSGNGFSFGLTARLSIPSLSGSVIKSSISGTLNYLQLQAKGELTGEPYPTIYKFPPNYFPTMIVSLITYNINLNYNIIDLGFCYSAKLFNSNFSVDLGGSIGILIKNRCLMSMNLYSPGMSDFVRNTWESYIRLDTLTLHNSDSIARKSIIRYNDIKTGILADGKIPNVETVSLSFLLGIRYDIKISKFILSPNIGYNYGNKINYLNFGMDVLY